MKSLEPAEYHSLENKKYALKKYKLTDELVRFLTGDQLRLELSQNEYEIGYIDFFALTDIIERKVGRHKLLRLSADIENYSDLQLVWNPKKKGLIGCYDVEHQTYADVCSLPISSRSLNRTSSVFLRESCNRISRHIGTCNLKFKLIVYRHMLYFDNVAFLKGGDIYDRDDGSYHCVDSLPFSFVTLRSSNT